MNRTTSSASRSVCARESHDEIHRSTIARLTGTILEGQISSCVQQLSAGDCRGGAAVYKGLDARWSLEWSLFIYFFKQQVAPALAILR